MNGKDWIRQGWLYSRWWEDIQSLDDGVQNCHGWFVENLVHQVGGGKEMSFWWGHWAENVVLGKEFPRLFRVARNPKAKVADLGRWEDERCVAVGVEKEPVRMGRKSGCTVKGHRSYCTIERRRR